MTEIDLRAIMTQRWQLLWIYNYSSKKLHYVTLQQVRFWLALGNKLCCEKGRTYVKFINVICDLRLWKQGPHA